MANVTHFTIDNVSVQVKDENAVSTIANQGLSEQQKSNARRNIGAGDSDFSGSYNDLTDKPTIPTVNNATLTIQKNGTTVQTFTANQGTDANCNITIAKSDVGLDNVPNVTTDNQTPTFSQASTRANIASGETLSTLFGKIMKWYADLKAVAFSGSYNDLTDKPTIPTVNNATLTIQKNGTNVQTFTANQSTNATCNITMAKSDVGLGNVPNVTTNNQAPTFSQASTRANIASGETLSTLFGKIMKWYADLKAVAFSGSYNDLSNKPSIPTFIHFSQTASATMNGVSHKAFQMNQISSSSKFVVSAVDVVSTTGYGVLTGWHLVNGYIVVEVSHLAANNATVNVFVEGFTF